MKDYAETLKQSSTNKKEEEAPELVEDFEKASEK
jgi:hypothetical protein